MSDRKIRSVTGVIEFNDRQKVEFLIGPDVDSRWGNTTEVLWDAVAPCEAMSAALIEHELFEEEGDDGRPDHGRAIMTTIETIQIGETSRLLVKADEDASCPRGDWHMLTGFVKIPSMGDSRLNDVPAVHDDPLRIAEKHEAVGIGWHEGQTYYRGNSSADQIIARWARIFHGLHVEYDSEHGGYWFVKLDGPEGFAANWPDLVLGTPEHLAQQAEVIKQEQETYRQWAEGEVYGVVLEREKLWVNVTRGGVIVGGDQKVTWEEAESLWGCHLDDSYTAKAVALEQFDLTDDERTALEGR